MTTDWDWVERARAAPLLPVVAVDDPERAVELTRALERGGARFVEITLRTPNALACIEAAKRSAGAALVGAGTVTRPEQVAALERIGVDFLVSPGLTPALTKALVATSIPALPGVATPSEALIAREAGFRAVKVFPARALGGPSFLRALAAIADDLALCPTGGVGLEAFPEYLASPNVFAVGASWPCATDLIADSNWGAVTRRTRRMLDAAGFTTDS